MFGKVRMGASGQSGGACGPGGGALGLAVCAIKIPGGGALGQISGGAKGYSVRQFSGGGALVRGGPPHAAQPAQVEAHPRGRDSEGAAP
jgi:hypothetical protein